MLCLLPRTMPFYWFVNFQFSQLYSLKTQSCSREQWMQKLGFFLLIMQNCQSFLFKVLNRIWLCMLLLLPRILLTHFCLSGLFSFIFPVLSKHEMMCVMSSEAVLYLKGAFNLISPHFSSNIKWSVTWMVHQAVCFIWLVVFCLE